MCEVLENVVKNNLINRISRFIEYLFSTKKTVADYEYVLEIPKNVYLRTELICRYITDDLGYDFELENFLMLLYLEFVQNSIKKYNPKKLFQDLNTNYYPCDTIILTNGVNAYSIDRINQSKVDLTINIEEVEVKKGQLILDELYELYNIKISFKTLLEKLWIKFIEDYKVGANKKTYTLIVNMLKGCKEI